MGRGRGRKKDQGKDQPWLESAYEWAMTMGNQAQSFLEARAARLQADGPPPPPPPAQGSSSSADAPEPPAREDDPEPPAQGADEEADPIALAKVRAMYYMTGTTPAGFEPQRHTAYILGRPVQAMHG